jgi:phosphomevalonate kinase
MIAVWSGASADPRAFLKILATFASNEPSSYGAIMGRLAGLSEASCKLFAAGDVEGFLDSIDAYAAGLNRLSQAAGIPIVTAEHTKIAEIAQSGGARYKPAGAGGGDLGIALCHERSGNAVREALVAAGCTVVPVGRSETGARMIEE